MFQDGKLLNLTIQKEINLILQVAALTTLTVLLAASGGSALSDDTSVHIAGVWCNYLLDATLDTST